MCTEWRNDFGSFLSAMGKRPPTKMLERIDNARGYEPGNCRWASRLEQANNCRTNHIVSIRGKTMTVAEAARKYGASYSTVSGRLSRGYTDEEAVFGRSR